MSRRRQIGPYVGLGIKKLPMVRIPVVLLILKFHFLSDIICFLSLPVSTSSDSLEVFWC